MTDWFLSKRFDLIWRSTNFLVYITLQLSFGFNRIVIIVPIKSFARKKFRNKICFTEKCNTNVQLLGSRRKVWKVPNCLTWIYLLILLFFMGNKYLKKFRSNWVTIKYVGYVTNISYLWRLSVFVICCKYLENFISISVFDQICGGICYKLHKMTTTVLFGSSNPHHRALITNQWFGSNDGMIMILKVNSESNDK